MKRSSRWPIFAWAVVCIPIVGVAFAVSQYSRDAGYLIALLGAWCSYFIVIPKAQGWLNNRGNHNTTQT